MIGFVCNYKHSWDANIKELDWIQAYGYPWLLLKNAAHMYTETHAHTHFNTSLQKQTLLFEMSEQLLHTPWRPFATNLKVITSSLLVCSCRVKPSPGLSCFRDQSALFFNNINAHPSKPTPYIRKKHHFETLNHQHKWRGYFFHFLMKKPRSLIVSLQYF